MQNSYLICTILLFITISNAVLRDLYVYHMSIYVTKILHLLFDDTVMYHIYFIFYEAIIHPGLQWLCRLLVLGPTTPTFYLPTTEGKVVYIRS
jgi:hypothetical protein